MLRNTGLNWQARPDLVPVVLEYLDAQNVGIAPALFPTRQTGRKYNVYGIFGAAQMLQQADDTAAQGARANQVDVRLGEGEYRTQKRQLETPINDDERDDFDAQYGSNIKAEEAKTKALMNALAINREIRVKNLVFNTSKFATHALTTPWSDIANSDPVADIGAAHVAQRALGFECRTLVVSYVTFMHLQMNKAIKELLKYTYNGLKVNNIPAADMAMVLGVDQILIGGARVNDAGLYVQDDSIKDIWPDEYAALVKVGKTGEYERACLGWGWSFRGDAENAEVDEYREPAINTDFIRAAYWASDEYIEGTYPNGDPLDISSKCIYLIGNVAG